ncbi:MAG: leucine-rich repeat domain-containing protein [Candidatus Sigynarchaeota archaeon]
MGSNHLHDLAGIEQFPNLKELWVCGNPITSLAGVDALPHLEILDATGCEHLSDLGGLEQSRSLVKLYLGKTKITRFVALDSLAKLEYLNLEDDHIECFENMHVLASLEYMSLNYADIAHPEGLSRVPNLKYLNLWGTRVPDYSFLEGMRTLEDVQLRFDDFTEYQRDCIMDFADWAKFHDCQEYIP